MWSINSTLCLFVLVVFSRVTSGQVATDFRTLVVNDHSGKLAVLQTEDKTYVDLKGLVQIAHGSVDYQGNKIILTLPGPAAHESIQAATPEESDSSRLTREFIKAGIEEISLMREWASTLANAIQNAYPVSEEWVASYRARAQKGLAMASAAQSNDADRSGFQLFDNEFQAVQEWSNKLLEAHKSMNAAKYAVSDTALRDDPLSQKIVTCGRFLGQMLASGNFQDDSSCH